jgi:hypothetical protein
MGASARSTHFNAPEKNNRKKIEDQATHGVVFAPFASQNIYPVRFLNAPLYIL